MTTPLERLETRLAAAVTRLDAIEDMIDTERRVIAAEKLKVETGSSQPQIIEPSGGGGNLELGTETGFRVVGTINQAVFHTGDTVETELGVIPLKANSMGPNGVIRVWSAWEGFPTGSGHLFHIYFGQKILANRISYWNHATKYTVRAVPVEVWNQGQTDAQKMFGSSGSNIAMVVHNIPNVAPLEMGEDTTAEVPIYFTGKVNNAAHTVALHYALVEACYRD